MITDPVIRPPLFRRVGDMTCCVSSVVKIPKLIFKPKRWEQGPEYLASWETGDRKKKAPSAKKAPLKERERFLGTPDLRDMAQLRSFVVVPVRAMVEGWKSLSASAFIFFTRGGKRDPPVFRFALFDPERVILIRRPGNTTRISCRLHQSRRRSIRCVRLSGYFFSA
jgi:hypothetical protein